MLRRLEELPEAQLARQPVELLPPCHLGIRPSLLVWRLLLAAVTELLTGERALVSTGLVRILLPSPPLLQPLHQVADTHLPQSRPERAEDETYLHPLLEVVVAALPLGLTLLEAPEPVMWE